MFTGIVQGLATVSGLQRAADIVTFSVSFPSGALRGVSVGASVSLDGCCLTLTSVREDVATFDLVPETLQRSSLGAITEGAEVNFERSLRFGDEIGGHLLSGHVDVVCQISDIEVLENSRNVTFKVAPEWTKYLFTKGYVALNGASLTLTKVDRISGEFGVSLIPETLAKTTFCKKVVGDRVNVEVDRSTQAIVETVERIMREGGATPAQG